MKNDILTGILTDDSEGAYLKSKTNEKLLQNEQIWDGYMVHWKNKKVHARSLPQKNYETGKHIYILWIAEEDNNTPFLELYYNERLVKYSASTFGHNAVNISGNIFNFSHYMNENEVITAEEYFFRPALGEFAPSPTTKRFALNENGKNYFDKFGRSFMRTIHVLRIEGVNEQRLSDIFNEELYIIHNSKPDPENAELYKDFSFLNRNCTTIIRDCLRKYGFKKIKGIFPRDFFISTAFECSKMKNLRPSIFTLPQLHVKEAPPSSPTPFMNPRNYYRLHKLMSHTK